MESTPATNIRCVYVYYRTSKTKGGLLTYPYYVGKGTIRRAYDWVRHTGFGLPAKAEDIHILGKDMSDVDARQAEMLLIYLYGRKLPSHYRKTIRPTWDTVSYRMDIQGTLVNKTIGGDGAACSDPTAQAQAAHNDKEFWEHNPCFSVISHPDGYWYSPQYPTIKSTHGKWLRKSRTRPGIPRKKKPAPPKHVINYDLSLRVGEVPPNDSLMTAEKIHFERFGDIHCYTRHLGYCGCESSRQ